MGMHCRAALFSGCLRGPFVWTCMFREATSHQSRKLTSAGLEPIDRFERESLPRLLMPCVMNPHVVNPMWHYMIGQICIALLSKILIVRDTP